MLSSRVIIWKGDILVADIEELKKLDASEIHPRRLNAKEVLTTHKDWEFVFPVADGSAKLSGRYQEFQEPTLRWECTVRRENLSGESQGDREDFQSEETKDDAETQEDIWSIQGHCIYRHHIEPRVQLFVPREKSFPFPLKFFDVIRSTHTDLDVAEEKRIDDCWNVNGSWKLSDSWTGFTRFTLLNETPPKGYMSSGRRLTKIQTTSRPDNTWPDAWTRIGKAAPRREKQEWAIEKPKLEYARNLRGIHSIDPGDAEYKDIIKNARRKLETPKAAAMSYKRAFPQGCMRETVVSKNRKSQGIWSEDQIRLYYWSTWIHKAKRRTPCRERAEFRIALQFGASIYSDAASNEDSRCKGSSGQGMEKAWDHPSMGREKGHKQEGGHQRGTEKQHQSSPCFIDGRISSEAFGVRTKITKIQRQSCASRRHCERRLWSLNMAHRHHKWRPAMVMDVIARLPDCDGKATHAVCGYTEVKLEDAQKLLKIPKSEECPDVWIRHPIHKWPKSSEYIEDPLVPLERNLYGHPLAGLVGKTVRKNDGTWLVKSTKLGMLIRS